MADGERTRGDLRCNGLAAWVASAVVHLRHDRHKAMHRLQWELACNGAPNGAAIGVAMRMETRIGLTSFLVQDTGGHGAFVQPLFKLLGGKDICGWGAAEKGALRSAFTNWQWPQARRHQAGLATSQNWHLCVWAVLCSPLDPDPRYTGHLVHRILTCAVTAQYQNQTAPAWILDLVRRRTGPDGALTLSPGKLDFPTKGIVWSPAPKVIPPPETASFVLVVPPNPRAIKSEAFVAGSRWTQSMICTASARARAGR